MQEQYAQLVLQQQSEQRGGKPAFLYHRKKPSEQQCRELCDTICASMAPGHMTQMRRQRVRSAPVKRGRTLDAVAARPSADAREAIGSDIVSGLITTLRITKPKTRYCSATNSYCSSPPPRSCRLQNSSSRQRLLCVMLLVRLMPAKACLHPAVQPPRCRAAHRRRSSSSRSRADGLRYPCPATALHPVRPPSSARCRRRASTT